MGKHYGLDIPTLSELRIDTDKEWLDPDDQPRGINNIKELVTSMAKGDLPVRGGLVIVRLIPGSIGNLLTSAGPGHIPVWTPPVGPLERWLIATIELTKSVQKVSVDRSYTKDAPLTTWNRQAYLDAPADYIKRLTPTIALPDAEAIVAADKTHNKNAPIASECAVEYAVGGAVQDDGGVQTDYTTEINSPTANDVPLLPVAPLAVNDAFYLGLSQVWDQAWLDIGVPGVGNYALAHEYWNGAAWSALPGVIDNTSEFTVAGKHNIKWTRPGDWALTIILAMNLYWIRTRVVTVVDYTTQPLGTQGWCEVIA